MENPFYCNILKTIVLQIKTIFSVTLVNRWKRFYPLFMEKYHVSIGFRPCHVQQARGLIDALQSQQIRFSIHALEELGREPVAVKIGQFLKDYALNFNDVFELALNAGKLEKMGFRVNFNENDVIFILSRDKKIITLWTNKKEDCHYTLDVTKYCNV
jgi:hypothetical protein